MGKYEGKTITNYAEKEGLNDTIISILEDRSGLPWFGSFNKGVIKYDGKTFTHYTENEGMIDNTIWDMHTHFTNREGLGNDIKRGLEEDLEGNLWVGT